MIIQHHKRKTPRERTKALVDQFVESMKTSLRFFADGELSDQEIDYLAEYTVNRLDFNDEWQMHKGLGYFARHAVERYLGEKEKDQGEKMGNKTLDYYLSLPYRYGIIADSVEGGYTAFYPDLPGCLTCAETLDDLKQMAEDAKRCWLKAALEDGVEIPEPAVLGPEGFPCHKSTQEGPESNPENWSESTLER